MRERWMTSVVTFSWVWVCVRESRRGDALLLIQTNRHKSKLNSSCVMYWLLISSRIARSTRAATSLLEFFKYQTIHVQANWRAPAHATSNHAVTTSHTRQGKFDHKIFLHWASYTACVQGQKCSVITNDTMQRNKPSWMISDQKELVQL